jgi:hypothetical protein
MLKSSTFIRLSITFLFLLFFGRSVSGQTTIASEGLNNSSSLFTVSGGLYYTGNSASGDRPATSPFAIEGTHSYGITSGTATLTSGNINTSGFSGVSLSFRLASFSISSTGNGADAADIVTVEISPDGGATYFSTVRVLGNTNAYWAYSATGVASTAYDGNAAPVDFTPGGGGSRTTDGYSTVTVTSLPSVSNLRVRITALNNATGERWTIDDFVLSGTTSNAPTKLAVTSIVPTSPTANSPFSVTVQSQDNGGVASSVSSNTDVTLSVNTGTGTLGGTITGTILGGTNSVVITGVTYSKAENGVVLTATRTAGDVLTAGNSAAFNVLAQASKLAFVGVPTSGVAGSNLATFTVEARRPDNTVDNTFTGDITITKNTGPGTITGTLVKSAVNGVATFNDIQFDQQGTYTITASSGSLTTATSVDIVVAAAPVIVQPGAVVINQFNPGYNGASDEFVELVNLTGNTVDLSTLKIIYQSAGGGAGGAGGTLSGIMQPHSFWLLSPNATISVGQTVALPRDGSISSGFSGSAGQLALQRLSDNVIIDGLAYGAVTTNNLGEGTAVAAPSTNGGYKRSPDGKDNNTNSLDFVAVAPTDIYLRNSTSRLANTGAAIVRGNYTDLVVTGNSSLSDSVFVTNLLDLVSGTLTTNDYLVLVSSVSKTARVGKVTAGTVTGNTTVERFIGIPAAKRAWRLLTAPLRSAGNTSIFDTWQSGGALTVGSGTLVTGPNYTGTDGLDANSGYSLKKFVDTSLVGVDNTKTTYLMTNTSGTVPGNNSYFIFVRGDRSSLNLANTSQTVLKATGALQIGDIIFPAAVKADSNTLVGNPYASPVDFALVTKSNLVNRFYAWDPNLNTVGGFVVVDDATNSGTYTINPPAGTTTAQTRHIQSGQAVFTQTAADGPASITFTEASKSTSVVNNVFRTNNGADEMMTATLHLLNAGNTTVVADAVMAIYNMSFADQVDMLDAPKMTNINENFGLVRNGKLLSIERRQLVDNADTLFLNLSQTTARDYRFTFEPANFAAPTVTAYLEDAYLHTSTPLSLSAPTSIDFAITPDVLSAAANRFMIVYKTSTTLPVNYNMVKAYQVNGGVQLEWNVASESGMRSYEAERSVDGRNFTKLSTVVARNNGATQYDCLDNAPVNGLNFYRIKAIDNAGVARYSMVVNVRIGGKKTDIVLYPNPVVGNTISLQFINEPKGIYTFKLFNNLGQVVISRSIVHNGGSATQTINLENLVQKGVYQLQVSNGALIVNQQVIKQ